MSQLFDYEDTLANYESHVNNSTFSLREKSGSFTRDWHDREQDHEG